jgi:hypothetical protein
VFSGLTVNIAGNGYAIAAESGGVTSNADYLVVSPSTAPPPPSPPAPPKVMGSAGLGTEQAGGQVGYRRFQRASYLSLGDHSGVLPRVRGRQEEAQDCLYPSGEDQERGLQHGREFRDDQPGEAA